MTPTSTPSGLSGQRFHVTYRVTGDAARCRAKADDICLEQTIELARDQAPPGALGEAIIGHIESFAMIAVDAARVVVSYPVEAADDLTQLLNVVFGNISMKPGIRVEAVALPPSYQARFHGPRFGIAGWRDLLGVPVRPLLCTALKPMGADAKELARRAHEFAVGGIDLIKDDHGLTNQSMAQYRERVLLCIEAVRAGNKASGHHAMYLPNVTARPTEALERAHFAKKHGAGGLLFAPGLAGFGTLEDLAGPAGPGLPIMVHPAFLGSHSESPDHGVAHAVTYGLLPRLAGGDATIYPNWGGRFSFSQEQCMAIATTAREPNGGLQPIFPTPGGGVALDRLPALKQVYGDDVIYLIGGSLYGRGPDLADNARHFRKLVE